MNDTAISEAVNSLGNSVCKDLPEGWQVLLCMERGAGWVDLLNPNGDLMDTGPMCVEESLMECVRRLVKAAIDYDKRK